MGPNQPPEAATRTCPLPEGGLGGEADAPYLLVFSEDSSSIHRLPSTGVVVIGRTPEADLVIQGSSISRKHSKIVIADAEASITDLDSSNGTYVNGQRIKSAWTLTSGDSISIGEVSLVFHCARAVLTEVSRRVIGLEQLRQRLEEEIERSLCYQRPLTVLALHLDLASLDRGTVFRSLGEHLPPVYLASRDGEGRLYIVVPEIVDRRAQDLAAALTKELSGGTSSVRAGFATCPADGSDAGTLLSAARAAAEAADPSSTASAATAVVTLQLGDRSIIVADPAVARVFELIGRLAKSDLPVLILGETGVGKENAAFAVHHLSARSKMPYVTLNCAAMQETLVESELFGHEKGAFSGAVTAKTGLLESASGGTVFLDEVGELSPAIQAKLLRVLEAKRITRVGGLREREIDVRIVAATNRNLEEEVNAGRFRQDLFFRLSAATVILPPLRHRPREIPILSRTFLRDACVRLKRTEMTVSAAAMQRLSMYAWPGNVRELKNTMDYVAAAIAEAVLQPSNLPERIAGPRPPPTPATQPEEEVVTDGAPGFRPLREEMDELERRRLIEALDATGGIKARAAALIAMPLRTFADRLKYHGLSPPTRK